MLFGGAGASGAGGTVRVEVADASDCPPRPRHAEGDDTNGRGLELVDGLADRWGWQPEGAGKQIWCEVDRSVPAGGPMGAPTGVQEAPKVVVQGGGEVCEPPLASSRTWPEPLPPSGASRASRTSWASWDHSTSATGATGEPVAPANRRVRR
ncbi:hypothetical protein SMICM304S_11124 [Streptomyces microflavus]